MIGDSDREREAQFPLAVLVHAIGRHVRLVRVEFVFHPLALLWYVDDRSGDITSAANDALVVEAAVSKQEVDLERVVLDAGEHALDRVGFVFVITDIRHRQCHRLFIGDNVGRAVSMAGRCPVFRSHRAEFAFLGVVIAVIGVIDEIDGDDSRPVRVENRHGKASKQEIGDELKPVTVKGVEPREDGVVTGRSIGVFAGFPDRGLVDTGEDDDEPDVAGVEGAPLDARQGERSNDFFRYVFDVRGRKVTVWVWEVEHIQTQTLSRGQYSDSILLISSFGKYRFYTVELYIIE